MKVRVYNANEGRFVETNYIAPNFVIDEHKFERVVQAEHITSLYDTLSDKVTSADEAYNKEFAKGDNRDDEKLARLSQRYQEATENLDIFSIALCTEYGVEKVSEALGKIEYDEIDRFGALFCIAHKLEKGTIGYGAFVKIFESIQAYTKTYQFVQEWTDDRKLFFGNIRKALNDYLKCIFVGMNEDIYKPFVPEFNATYTTDVINRVSAIMDTAKDKEQNIGFAWKAGKISACYRAMIMCLLHKYGCEAVNTKKERNYRWNF